MILEEAGALPAGSDAQGDHPCESTSADTPVPHLLRSTSSMQGTHDKSKDHDAFRIRESAGHIVVSKIKKRKVNVTTVPTLPSRPTSSGGLATHPAGGLDDTSLKCSGTQRCAEGD